MAVLYRARFALALVILFQLLCVALAGEAPRDMLTTQKTSDLRDPNIRSTYADAESDSRKRKGGARPSKAGKGADDKEVSPAVVREELKKAGQDVDHAYEGQEFYKHVSTTLTKDLSHEEKAVYNEFYNKHKMNEKVYETMNHADNLKPLETKANICKGAVIDGKCHSDGPQAQAALEHMKSVEDVRVNTATKLADAHAKHAEELKQDPDFMKLGAESREKYLSQ
ncbi:hypothetical protein HDU67_010141 [Dinochytrium kinnereticum]|nr:hypothetical protein HDU67_010141 [Dinochytrium kinnereticum]